MAERTFLEQLDEHDNEAAVHERLAAGNYNSRHAALAHEWLRRRELARSTVASAKRDTREEEALSISKRANAIAEEALSIANLQATAAAEAAAASLAQARWAKWAAILAAIAALTANKDQILALIFGSP